MSENPGPTRRQATVAGLAALLSGGAGIVGIQQFLKTSKVDLDELRREAILLERDFKTVVPGAYIQPEPFQRLAKVTGMVTALAIELRDAKL